MFRTLKNLFDDGIARLATREAAIDTLPLAVAALLLEIARADHQVDEAERRAVVAAVARVCVLDADALQNLLHTASEVVEEAVSLFEFTDVVNARLERGQKLELLQLLWRVAYADGRLDHYEEYYIRKVADLLHLSHSEFIRAKLAASPPATSST